jgi:succinoglycan biosynthesis protein ExoA
VNQRADRPSISVIVPALNEAATIRRAISPLLADPLAVDLEVIVAVGPSTDETREVLMEMADRDARIRLLDNPARITPEGLNAAIRASQGSVILRMDGHAEPDPGYVSACLDALKNSGAWNVGGRIRKVGLTSAARAAAAATSSPFGIGGGKRFHLLSEPQYVDTLWPGCWPRWVFERVGLFDPEMVQNQDDEFNQRIIEAGGTIRFDPAISAAYISRGSWHGLVRQYFRYGIYKSPRHPEAAGLLRPRHLVPAIMVASAVGTLLLGMLTPWGLLAFGLEARSVACGGHLLRSAGCPDVRCDPFRSGRRLCMSSCFIRAGNLGRSRSLRTALVHRSRRIGSPARIPLTADEITNASLTACAGGGPGNPTPVGYAAPRCAR